MAVSKYQKRMHPLILFVHIAAALLLLSTGIFAVSSPIRFLQNEHISLGGLTSFVGMTLGMLCILSGSLLIGLLFSLPKTKISSYGSAASIITAASVFLFLSIFGLIFSTELPNIILYLRELFIRLLVIGVLLIIRMDVS